MKPDTGILLYDDYCPLCTWYSGMFVKLKLLAPENRVPFSKADLSILTAIDIEKGKDEIPLYNISTGKTLYGIDALLEILGKKFPWMKWTGKRKPINWALRKLYKFVSYNRKVIVAKKCGPGTFDCSPVFSLRYRLLFIFIFLVFNSLALIPLHKNLFSTLPFYSLNLVELESAHLVFVLINCVLALFLKKKKGIEYLGQVNMLALITILLLLLLSFIYGIIQIPALFIAACFGALTVIIIKEYFRRMKYANMFSGNRMVILINIFCVAIFLGYVFH